MENLEHLRARKAYDCVNAINEDTSFEDKDKKAYRSLVQSCGPLIRRAGLFQTLGFYLQKGKPHHQALADHILQWLFDAPGAQPDSLYFNKLLQLPDREAWRCTEKAQDFVVWLKRFAVAILPDPNQPGEGSS